MKIHSLNSSGTMAVVIPKNLADMLGWEPGQDVVVIPTPDECVVKVINKTLKDKKDANL